MGIALMRIVFTCSVGYGRHEDSFDVEDDATDKEIGEFVRDAVFETLDWSWTKESTNDAPPFDPLNPTPEEEEDMVAMPPMTEEAQSQTAALAPNDRAAIVVGSEVDVWDDRDPVERKAVVFVCDHVIILEDGSYYLPPFDRLMPSEGSLS